MDSLIVYLNDRPVGRLSEENGEMSFSYDSAYVADGTNEPLSYSLPLQIGRYSHSEIEPFVSGLLPEDIIRTRLGRILQIPRENTFAFLKAIGGDCAGAVSFFPEGEGPESSGTRYRQLSDEEAGLILDNLERKPLDVGEDGFRISGAGAQDKLIACWRNGRIALPLGGTPSTHIIKTAIRDYPDSVENECFSMKLADACGLNCAPCAISVIGGKRRYVCARYDRVAEDGRVRRLHQEDFCQILRIAPALKYEALGGPGIQQSMELLRKLALPATDTIEFIRRIVFFFLVGNGDAHGKNFSVLYHGRHVSLSPLYDVMSTTVYPDVAARLAMKIDGEYAFRWISRGKFLRMAERLGIAPRMMERELTRMCKLALAKAPVVADRLSARFPSACYGKIISGIRSRVRQISSDSVAEMEAGK